MQSALGHARQRKVIRACVAHAHARLLGSHAESFAKRKYTYAARRLAARGGARRGSPWGCRYWRSIARTCAAPRAPATGVKHEGGYAGARSRSCPAVCYAASAGARGFRAVPSQARTRRRDERHRRTQNARRFGARVPQKARARRAPRLSASPPCCSRASLSEDVEAETAATGFGEARNFLTS